ncbi:cytochrome P450 [Yinghuangia sp. YIM S09857]|uniref:cytochrome P450 n=1 Tax=Yinghuangia sp. YIM S09857 TaxID=3436929 RepID=UPI003F53A5A9
MAFDPFDPAIFDNPVPSYHWLLEEEPAYWCEPRNIWVLSRFDDVWSATLDWQTFSSADGNVYGETQGSSEARKRGSASIVMMDPPQHNKLRTLVSRAFTRRRMQEMRERVRELTRPRIERLVNGDAPDFARDLAIPLPGIVIADMVGVEREYVDELAEATVDMVLVQPDDPDFTARRTAAVRTLDAYFARAIAERRAAPRDDLVSDLIAAEVGGEQLTDGEIAGFGRALFNGGHGTTTTLLGGSIVALAHAPEQRARLVADPAMIPGAVEELVRYVSPVQAVMRTVTRDVTFHGKTLRAGDRALLLLAAANRDPRVFDAPDRFDVGRQITQRLGFGVGVHHCIGAQLARVEVEVVLEELLKAAPEYALAGDIRYENILTVRSLHSVPFRAVPEPIPA